MVGGYLRGKGALPWFEYLREGDTMEQHQPDASWGKYILSSDEIFAVAFGF